MFAHVKVASIMLGWLPWHCNVVVLAQYYEVAMVLWVVARWLLTILSKKKKKIAHHQVSMMLLSRDKS